MRILRNKHHRKILQQYRILFGISPRYKVLIDGNFLHIATHGHVDLHDMLPKLLQSRDVVLFVTKCVYAELQSLGSDFDETCDVAQTMKFAKCSHKKPVSAAECLKSLVGGKNTNHYFVATQDAELRGEMREIPGTPLLLFNRQVLVIDKLSQASLDFSSKVGRTWQADELVVSHPTPERGQEDPAVTTRAPGTARGVLARKEGPRGYCGRGRRRVGFRLGRRSRGWCRGGGGRWWRRSEAEAQEEERSLGPQPPVRQEEEEAGQASGPTGESKPKRRRKRKRSAAAAAAGAGEGKPAAEAAAAAGASA